MYLYYNVKSTQQGNESLPVLSHGSERGTGFTHGTKARPVFYSKVGQVMWKWFSINIHLYRPIKFCIISGMLFVVLLKILSGEVVTPISRNPSPSLPVLQTKRVIFHNVFQAWPYVPYNELASGLKLVVFLYPMHPHPCHKTNDHTCM